MNLTLFVFCFLGIIIALGLAQKPAIPKPESKKTKDTKAPSTYQNCDCQCDSYTWETKNKGKKYIMGNCKR